MKARLAFALLAVALSLAMIPGCGPAAAGPTLSRDQVIKKAAEDARRSVPEVGIREARVDRVEAELLTLEEVARRFPGDRDPESLGSGRDKSTPVWYVTVEGHFRYEGMPFPDGKPGIYEATRRDFVYDGRTGEFIASRIPTGLVTMPSEEIGRTPPEGILLHDRGKALRLEPGSQRFGEVASVVAKLLQGVRPGIIAALADPWKDAERIQQEGVAVEIVYPSPGIPVADHGNYTRVLVQLDKPHSPREGSAFLGNERYTRLVSVNADEALAELRKALGATELAAPEVPARPTAAPMMGTPGTTP